MNTHTHMHTQGHTAPTNPLPQLFPTLLFHPPGVTYPQRPGSTNVKGGGWAGCLWGDWPGGSGRRGGGGGTLGHKRTLKCWVKAAWATAESSPIGKETLWVCQNVSKVGFRVSPISCHMWLACQVEEVEEYLLHNLIADSGGIKPDRITLCWGQNTGYPRKSWHRCCVKVQSIRFQRVLSNITIQLIFGMIWLAELLCAWAYTFFKESVIIKRGWRNSKINSPLVVLMDLLIHRWVNSINRPCMCTICASSTSLTVWLKRWTCDLYKLNIDVN